MARPVEEDDGSIGEAGNSVGGGSGGTENPSIVGKNLRDSNNVSIRPTNLSSAHLYNLRNQTWAITRLSWTGNDTSLDDPISMFKSAANKFPSNADSVNLALYANTGSSNDKVLERFNVRDLINNPPGNTLAPLGHYIIDALDRGSSRLAAMAQEKIQYPQIDYVINTLPADKTPGGPSIACEYAGRVFYAGFSGQIIDGDSNSPRLSSYVLFSQLVTDASSVTNCYQQADPTNKDENDLVDTDGGFIRFEGAYQIVGMVNIGTYLAVIANNGVWLLTGGNNSGFKATDYQTSKITNNGCISPGSIVVVDNTFYYWGTDGIYYVSPNQFGDYTAVNITEKTIQKYFALIPTNDAVKCEGVYDSYEKKVRWLYGNSLGYASPCKELVIDLSLGAFYPSIIESLDLVYPKVVKGIQTEPYIINNDSNNVVFENQQVVFNGQEVVTLVVNNANAIREIKYLVIFGANPGTNNIVYSFGSYSKSDHYDWKRVDGVGKDAKSFLLTGTYAGNDTSRKKTVPYITTHMKKTESGFSLDESGDYEPRDQSSCIVQAQWNWTNSANSGQWGRPFQAYRMRRHFIPTDLNTYDDGYYVVETRSKLRGSGKVLSLLFQSEPNKHCDLLGWSMPVETSTDV